MDAIEELPLFPLSDVVLLPQISVPLYIFELRYRQMTRDALAGAREIGMVAVRPNGVSAMQDDPPIFEVGCVGRITQARERPDGTFQILLVGGPRFRILEEHSRKQGRLYRSARVALLEDPGPSTPEETARVEAHRIHVLDVWTRLMTRSLPKSATEQRLAGFSALEPRRLIYTLAQAIAFDPIERQQLLEADSILTRFEIMGDLLRFRFAEDGASRPETGSLPN